MSPLVLVFVEPGCFTLDILRLNHGKGCLDSVFILFVNETECSPALYLTVFVTYSCLVSIAAVVVL